MTSRRRPGPADRPLPFAIVLTAVTPAAIVTPAELRALLADTTTRRDR